MENVYVVTSFFAKVQTAYKEVSQDGKVDFKDAIQLIPLLVELPNVIAAAPIAYNELKAADHAKRAELNDRLIADLQIESGAVENLIAKSVDAGVGIVQAIQAGLDLNGTDSPE